MNATERRAKDLVVDCCNSWTKWTEIQIKSVAVVEQLANKRILLIDVDASTKIHSDFDVDECKFELNRACERLRDILKEYERILTKLEKIRTNFDALRRLTSTNGVTNVALSFVSWTPDRIHDSIVVVHEQLKKEFKCKSIVFETIPFAETREMIEICTSSWMHQPYLDEKELNFLTAALAFEVGL